MRRGARALRLALGALALGGLAVGEARAEVGSDGGAWFVGVGQGDFAAVKPELSRMRWWLDAQIRFNGDSSGFDQSLLRPGLGWAATEHTSLWLGYAWIHTSPADGADTHEHRIWEQLLWSRKFEPASVQSRTRLEQRFLEGASGVGWRFRQFVKLSRPFGFEPRLGLVGYDEVFVNLNDVSWGPQAGFDRNRLMLGFSWTFAPGVVGELGYLNQYIHRSGANDRMEHLLAVQLLFNR